MAIVNTHISQAGILVLGNSGLHFLCYSCAITCSSGRISAKLCGGLELGHRQSEHGSAGTWVERQECHFILPK